MASKIAYRYVQRSDGSVFTVRRSELKALLAKRPHWKVWKRTRDRITPSQILCPICMKVFRTVIGLNRHRGVHR